MMEYTFIVSCCMLPWTFKDYDLYGNANNNRSQFINGVHKENNQFYYLPCQPVSFWDEACICVCPDFMFVFFFGYMSDKFI